MHFAASSGRSSCPFVNLAAGPAVQLKLTGSSAWRPAGQACTRQAVQFQLAFLKKSTLGAHWGITLEAIVGVQRALREPKGRPKGPKCAQQAQKCSPKGAQRVQRMPKGTQRAPSRPTRAVQMELRRPKGRPKGSIWRAIGVHLQAKSRPRAQKAFL